ncbi:hypothetical protein LINPERPRIM_LOCUS33052 [Linum perenne]
MLLPVTLAAVQLLKLS